MFLASPLFCVQKNRTQKLKYPFKNKTNKMKRFLVSLITYFVVGMPFLMAGEPCEVQVVTAEDYGLELDWALPLKSLATTSAYGVDVSFVRHDSEGNIYCGGTYRKTLVFPDGTKLTRPDERICIYIAKFTKNGDLVWCKDFYHTSEISKEDGFCSLLSILDVKEGATVLNVAVSFSSWGQKSPTTYFYDGIQLTELREETTEFNYINLSVVDGKLVNRFSMSMATGIRPGSNYKDFLRMDNGDYLLGCYIDTTFTGINGYESKCRSPKNWSRYIVRLDASLNVKWDYAYAVELTNVGLESRTPGELFCIGDTLYNLFHYEAADYNVNPEGDSIVVNRKYTLAFEAEAGSLIVKSDISGDKPEFLGYWHFAEDKLPVNLRSNSKGEIVASKQTYFNSLCSCVKISGNVEVEDVNKIPFQNSSWWWTDLNPTYSFGEDDRICVLGYDACGSLIYKFTEEMDSIRFKTLEGGPNYMLSLYGRDSSFHSAITTDLVDLNAMTLDDRRGSFCLGVNNEYNTISWVQIPIDWDPNPNKEVYNRDSKKYVEIVKYTETFRIKPKVAGNGRIVLQDSFVRFGESAVIEVVPEAGSRIDSVVTSRGEILTSENGLFKIENVTDVVGVTAYFSNSTGVETYETDKIRISPNPTTGEIRVENKENFDYEILDMQGKTQLQGHSEDGVLNVGGLPGGEYMLKIENYISIFYKK